MDSKSYKYNLCTSMINAWTLIYKAYGSRRNACTLMDKKILVTKEISRQRWMILSSMLTILKILVKNDWIE